jgi:hypothetical protein
MRHRNARWKATERNRFIATLIETGNPAIAADAIGQTLASAYQMRDRCPVLEAEWHQALSIAYEQVEMRMLSNLLDGRANSIDARTALEMLKRRAPAASRPMVTIDAARITRIRNEIRALAGPSEE